VELTGKTVRYRSNASQAYARVASSYTLFVRYFRVCYVFIELFFGLRCKQLSVNEKKIEFRAHKCSTLSAIILTETALYVNETMDIFVVGFWILTVICIALFILTHKSTGVSSVTDTNFRAFQRLYLIVFLLAMGNILPQINSLLPYIIVLYILVLLCLWGLDRTNIDSPQHAVHGIMFVIEGVGKYRKLPDRLKASQLILILTLTENYGNSPLVMSSNPDKIYCNMNQIKY